MDQMDRDRDGSLHRKDLDYGFDNVLEFQQLMKLMNLTKIDLDVIFEMLDADDNGEVTYTEFIEQLWLLRNADAQSLFIYTLRHVTRIAHAQTCSLKAQLKKQNQRLSEEFKMSANSSRLPEQASTNARHNTSTNGRSCNDKALASPLARDIINPLLALKAEITKDLQRLIRRINTEDILLKSINEDLSMRLSAVICVEPETYDSQQSVCTKSWNDQLHALNVIECRMRQDLRSLMAQICGPESHLDALQDDIVLDETAEISHSHDDGDRIKKASI
jgi:hypothetical protein